MSRAPLDGNADPAQAGEGPFRRGQATPLCAVCGEPSGRARCPRCDRPHCPTHAPPVHRRCTWCEEELVELERKRTLAPWTALLWAILTAAAGAAVPLVLYGHLVDKPACLIAGVITLIAVPFGALGLRMRYQHDLRSWFLDETPAQRDLGTSCDPLSAVALTLALCVPTPGAPLIGTILAVRARDRPWPGERSGRRLAGAAVAIGVTFTALQGVLALGVHIVSRLAGI